MTQLGQPFRHTHTAPAAGMDTWPTPGSPTPGPRLDPHLPVQVRQLYGDWAEVVCTNGWSAWVDGRALVPLGAAPVAAGVAATPSAGMAGRKLSVPVAAGAALVAVSTVLPWIDVGHGADTVNALDVSAKFLLGYEHAAEGGPGVGIVLLVLAGAAFALRHASGWEKTSSIPGALCAVVGVAFLVQMNAFLGSMNQPGAQDVPSLLDVVGIGLVPALIGAALLSWGSPRS